MSRVAPCGTWTSPLSAADVAGGGLRLGVVSLDGDDVYWLEGRPQESGRYVVMRRSPDGGIAEATPSQINVRSRVHEYGGAAYVVARGVVYCANFTDQRVYRVSGAVAEPVTPSGAWCYADFEIDTRRQRLICVREDRAQEGHEPVNALVGVSIGPADPGFGEGTPGAVHVLASGADFYSTARVSPDGSRLAWLSWNHPCMPWDGTELWVAQVLATGELDAPVRIAGGPEESIYQPGWAPDGSLYYVSDRDGWWTLYRATANQIHPTVTNAASVGRAEFGRPQWVFGTSTWACAGRRRLSCPTRAPADGTWPRSTCRTAR